MHLNKRAILLGFLASQIVWLVLIILAVVFGAVLALKGYPREEAEAIVASPIVKLIPFLLGILFTVLGGFVTARVADHEKERHARYLGFIFLLLLFFSSIIMLAYNEAYDTFWIVLDGLGLVLALPLTIFGARLAIKYWPKDKVEEK